MFDRENNQKFKPKSFVCIKISNSKCSRKSFTQMLIRDPLHLRFGRQKIFKLKNVERGSRTQFSNFPIIVNIEHQITFKLTTFQQ